MISSRLIGRDSLLFVYGTLREFSAIPMARRLREQARYLGVAYSKGRLYDLGAYPGLRDARARGEWVVGDVYRLSRPGLLRTLDRYEAGAAARRPRFVRQRRRIVLTSGRRVDAWVYVYRPSVSGRRRIASGDYRRHSERGRAA
jgi:gamma-glutamylcyclotransferase (GGCT)/AIG2-like uncharacterized protein YtfP